MCPSSAVPDRSSVGYPRTTPPTHQRVDYMPAPKRGSRRGDTATAAPPLTGEVAPPLPTLTRGVRSERGRRVQMPSLAGGRHIGRDIGPRIVIPAGALVELPEGHVIVDDVGGHAEVGVHPA